MKARSELAFQFLSPLVEFETLAILQKMLRWQNLNKKITMLPFSAYFLVKGDYFKSLDHFKVFFSIENPSSQRRSDFFIKYQNHRILLPTHLPNPIHSPPSRDN
jgi:hypothetical protein